MKKLLPVILALVGLLGGLAAGQMLKPPPPEEEGAAHAAGDAPGGMMAGDGHGAAPGDGGGHGDEAAMQDVSGDLPSGADHNEEEAAKYEYVALDKQFVVPLVDDARVQAMIIMSMSIETTAEGRELVTRREPKLRDVFLQVLFRHSHSGGFNGVFTGGQVMSDLRAALRDAAQGVLGDAAHDVLVTDIVRQDM